MFDYKVRLLQVAKALQSYTILLILLKHPIGILNAVYIAFDWTIYNTSMTLAGRFLWL
jgi:hypothetical protein